MSKLSSIINKQLLNTILPSSSSSSPVKLFNITKSPLKSPSFLTPVLNFSRNPIPKQSFLFSPINISFNLNPRSQGRNQDFISVPARSFCSSTSPHSEIEVNQTSSEVVAEKDNLWVSIPVRAYYKFNRIDLKGLVAENKANLIPHASGDINYVIIKFQKAEHGLTTHSNAYILVIKFSSRNLFSLVPHCLIVIYWKVDCFQIVEYEVRENSELPMWMQGVQSCLMLQHLDIDGICVISSVDGVIAAFTELPSGRRTIRSYMISEIAFMEDTNYSRMLKYLKDQFELNQKFAGLDFYLRLME
ncbi:hypothetical protein MKW94_000105, partial [Papaver nudicaule]|nr:hypothetical protein [Papaver nudicaule]